MLIETLFRNQKLFDLFRFVVHGDFKFEKKLIVEEINLDAVAKVLDFGCGIGQYSTIFENKTYHGVDSDELCINYALKKFKGTFVLSKSDSLPFANDFFDLILIINTFHHVSEKDLQKILCELKRVLNKSGKIFILDVERAASQPNIISKTMLKLDRGKFARDFAQIRPAFEKYFRVEKHGFVNTAIYKYREYFAVLCHSVALKQ